MSRQAQLFIFVGTNGTGKTTAMKKFLKVRQRNLIIPANRYDRAWHGYKEMAPKWVNRYDERTEKDIRVLSYPHINNFKGDAVVHADTLENFKAVVDIKQGFVNGSLFLDDFKNYIPTKGNLPGHVMRLLSDRRHRMLDIYMATHSFQNINADIFNYNPTLFIFNVTRPPEKHIAEKIQNFNELMIAYNRVVKQNAQLPDGKKRYFEMFQPA